MAEQRMAPWRRRWRVARVVWLAMVGAGAWLGVAAALWGAVYAGARVPALAWAVTALVPVVAVLGAALHEVLVRRWLHEILFDLLGPRGVAPPLPRLGESTVVGFVGEGRPYLPATVVLPRLRASASVSFLVDTGADRTLISPADALRLGYDYACPGPPESVVSVAGEIRLFSEEAVVAAPDSTGGQVHAVPLTVSVLPPSPWSLSLPSILGRDFLVHFDLHLDIGRETVVLRPKPGDEDLLTVRR